MPIDVGGCRHIYKGFCENLKNLVLEIGGGHPLIFVKLWSLNGKLHMSKTIVNSLNSVLKFRIVVSKGRTYRGECSKLEIKKYFLYF